MFTSCSEDRDSNPTLIQPTEFVLNETNWREAIVELENNTDSLLLSWSAPSYTTGNAPVIVTYYVDFSPKGTFEKAYNAAAEDNTGADYMTMGTATNLCTKKFGAEELNRVYLQFYNWKSEKEVPASMNGTFRVRASVDNSAKDSFYPIISNMVNITVLPYFVLLKPADPEIWWLIGSDIADGSWGSDIGKSVIPLQTIEDESYDMTTGQGKIQWKGYLAGNGFKLRGSLDDGWASQWGQGSGFGDYVKNDGGSGNITVPSAGLYTVSLDTQNDVLTIEPITTTPPVFDGMAISGSFNGWSDTEMTPCSTANENHDWYIEFTFSDGDEVKIKQAGSWDYNSGGEIVEREDGFYVYGGQGAANIYIAEGGDYMILYNDITRYIRFIKK